MRIRSELAVMILVACLFCGVVAFRTVQGEIVGPNEAQAQYVDSAAITAHLNLVDEAESIWLEYKLIGDSLFVHDMSRMPAVWGNVSKAWRFLGILERADTTIIRYEGADIKHYWR